MSDDLPPFKRQRRTHASSQFQQLDWRLEPPEKYYSDWTIHLKTPTDDNDDKVYHVHRNVLVTGPVSSKYFETAFESKYLQEGQESVSNISLSEAEARAFPILLDFFYGIEREENINEESFEGLLALADYLQVIGTQSIVEEAILGCEVTSIDGAKKFMNMYSILQEHKSKTSCSIEVDDLIVDTLSSMIQERDCLHGIDFASYAPISLKMLAAVAAQGAKTIQQTRRSGPSEKTFRNVLVFIGHVVRLHKQDSPSGMIADFFSMTFDDEFWEDLKKGTHGIDRVYMCIFLLNLEFEVCGTSDDGRRKYSESQMRCKKMIEHAFRRDRFRQRCQSMNEYLFYACNSDFQHYLSSCKSIPKDFLLELMRSDYAGQTSEESFTVGV